MDGSANSLSPTTTQVAHSSDWVERAMVLGAIPGLIVSQWLAVRWGLPTRFAFNLVMLAGFVWVLVRRWRNLARFRREVAIGLAILVVIAGSGLVNGVDPETLIPGMIPYAGFVLAVLAGLATAIEERWLRTGAVVSSLAAIVVAVAALLQTVIGRPAYVAFGQDLAYPRWWERGRATGLLANPGRLGQLGVLWVAVAPAVGGVGGLTIAAVVAAGLAVGTSGTRIALVAALGLGVAWLVTRRTATSRLLLIGSAAAIVTFAVVVAAVPSARDDFFGRAAAVAGGPNGDIRVANLDAVAGVVADYPFLGAGPGRFGSTTAWRQRSDLHERYDLPDVRSEEFVDELSDADVDIEIDVGIAQLEMGWGQIAAEIGLVAVAAFAVMFGSLFVRAVRAVDPTATALVIVLAVLSLAAPGITDFSLAAVILWWIGIRLGAAPFASLG